MTNSPFSIDEQIKEVEREIAMRIRVYPGMIKHGKMSREKADAQTDCMRAVLETLWGVKDPKLAEYRRSIHADESA